MLPQSAHMPRSSGEVFRVSGWHTQQPYCQRVPTELTSSLCVELSSGGNKMKPGDDDQENCNCPLPKRFKSGAKTKPIPPSKERHN